MSWADKHGLYPCPCNKAVECRMDETCLGCEEYAQWLIGYNADSRVWKRIEEITEKLRILEEKRKEDEKT